jgi:hypothetical protein
MVRGMRRVWIAGFLMVSLLWVGGLSAYAGEGEKESVPAEKPAAKAAAQSPTLEGLIKAAELTSFKLNNGMYKVLLSPGTGSQVVPVILREGSLGSSGVKIVYLWACVLEVPEGFKHPAAMLKKLADANDNIVIGRLSVNAKNGNVFYNSGFWLRTADEKTLLAELEIAFHMATSVNKDLKPFVTEQQ